MTEQLAPEAVPAWLAEHGLDASRAVLDGECAWLLVGDEPRARVCPGWAAGPVPSAGSDVAAWVLPPAHLALVLVRRGGYAVGLAEGGRLVAHKCGTRYVQSRTAAGGWSQQRFQRRRENQAAGLLEAAGDHLARLLAEHTGEPASGAAERWVDGVVLGGDKLLLGELARHPILAALAGRPEQTFPGIGDPDLKVLRRTLWQARSVQVTDADLPA